MFEKDASLIMSDSRFLNERKLYANVKYYIPDYRYLTCTVKPFTGDTIYWDPHNCPDFKDSLVYMYSVE